MSQLTGDWNRIDRKTRHKPLAFAMGIYMPNSPLTVARKGSSKPLIDKGDLVGSITYQVIDSNNVFIGVKKGKEANIAAVHEFGCVIQVTPKMRAYLYYQGVHLKPSTQMIYIPPRPFLRSVLNSLDFRAKVTEIYIDALERMFLH